MEPERTYRFQTTAEANEWKKKNYPNGGGLYQHDRIYLMEVKEEYEMYLESGKLGIDVQDLYDIKYGILRYEI